MMREMEDAAHHDKDDDPEVVATTDDVDGGGNKQEDPQNVGQIKRGRSWRAHSFAGEIEQFSFSSSTRSFSSWGSINEHGNDGSNSSLSRKPSDASATGRFNIKNLWKKKTSSNGKAGQPTPISPSPDAEPIAAIDGAFEDEFHLRLPNIPHTSFQRFPLKKLQAATHDFARQMLLWKRECMHRYMGYLDDVGQVVVERFMDVDVVSAKELFFSEVQALFSLRHRNIVHGIGWCHEGQEYLVVHELPLKGTLHSQLHSPETILPWDVRYNISLDLAYAVLYIHEGYDYCILHRNIQSVNVMLDSNSNAKLSSFYGAKIVDEGISYDAVLTTWAIGYGDPEFLKSHVFSKASDVYNFGLLLLEIATGSLLDSLNPKHSRLWELYEKNMLHEAVDRRLKGRYNEEEMVRLILMGLLCALPVRESRPSMREVVRYLNFEDYLKNSPFRITSDIESSIGKMPQSHGSGESSKSDNASCEASEIVFVSDASCDASETDFVSEVGATLSSEAFDIGISSAYISSGKINQFQRQIIEGFLSSLDEKLKTGEKFDEILQSIKIFTSAIVAVHAPVENWNLLVQYILSALKEIESITATYKVETAYKQSRSLSSVRMELEQHVAVCKEDKQKLSDANSTLTSRKKKQISLRQKLDSLQSQIVELERQLKVVEDDCQSMEDEVLTTERRRTQNLEKVKHIKLECKILELYESVFSRISLFSFD